MKTLTKLGIATVAAAITLTATHQAASAASFSFSQGGYSEGASVTGMFTGEDLDNDGVINSFIPGEVTGYTISFSGNSLVPAFSHGLPELFGLIYFLGSDIGDFFPSDGIRSVDATSGTFYGTSTGTAILPGPFFPGGKVGTSAGALDLTSEFVTVTPKGVPEPSAVLGLGLVGLAAFASKRKFSAQRSSDKA
jgi:hypothetical protein